MKISKLGRIKKFDKINIATVNTSIKEAKQKPEKRKGIDFSRRSIAITPFNA